MLQVVGDDCGTRILRTECIYSSGWEDVKQRLGPLNRRCFAFFHPSMPGEPLVFIQVALTRQMSDRFGYRCPPLSFACCSQACGVMACAALPVWRNTVGESVVSTCRLLHTVYKRYSRRTHRWAAVANHPRMPFSTRFLQHNRACPESISVTS